MKFQDQFFFGRSFCLKFIQVGLYELDISCTWRLKIINRLAYQIVFVEIWVKKEKAENLIVFIWLKLDCKKNVKFLGLILKVPPDLFL